MWSRALLLCFDPWTSAAATSTFCLRPPIWDFAIITHIYCDNFKALTSLFVSPHTLRKVAASWQTLRKYGNFFFFPSFPTYCLHPFIDAICCNLAPLTEQIFNTGLLYIINGLQLHTIILQKVAAQTMKTEMSLSLKYHWGPKVRFGYVFYLWNHTKHLFEV